MGRLAKMVVSMLLVLSLFPQVAFAAVAPESPEIPKDAIVIYADSEEDAQRQMDAYENWVISNIEVEQVPATTRANINGIHFKILAVNEVVAKIYLDYYYDTSADLPTNVYNSNVTFSDFIGINHSVNSLYTRIVNTRYIQSDFDIHYEYYLILEGVGKIMTRNQSYRVMHNVVTGQVDISKVG